MDGFEFGIVIFDERFGFGLAESGFLLGGSGHINGNLRIFGKAASEFTERFVRFGDDFGDYETSEDAIASRFTREDNVAGLFPAERDVGFVHGGFDIGIANLSNLDINALFLGPV